MTFPKHYFFCMLLKSILNFKQGRIYIRPHFTIKKKYIKILVIMKTSAIRQKCHLFSRGNFWTKKLILINKKVICDFTNWMVRTIVGTDLERGDFAGLKRCLLWIYLYYFFTWETVITIFRRQAIITYIWFCKSS